MKKDCLVVKPHSIITAKMNLSAKEQDLLTLLLISVKKEYDKLKFNNDYDDSKLLELIPLRHVFSKDEISEMFGIAPIQLYKKDKKTGNYLLQAACESLFDKSIKVKFENGQFSLTRLLSHAAYDGRNLTLEVPAIIVKELINYSKSGMGIIDYKLLFKLKGKYDKRILELISRFKNKRDFYCTIADLCEMIGADFDEYVSWRSFSESVLNKPIKSLIKESKGLWSLKDVKKKGYEITKKSSGKSYTKEDIITFKFKYTDSNLKKDLMDKYSMVLAGQLSSKKELLNLLDDLNNGGMKEQVSNLEFIKMWASCMAVAE